MSRFDKIKNLSVYNDLTASPTSWYFNTNLHFVPDEVIVRQISYNGPPTQDGVFMIWCSITNEYIGSFAVLEAAVGAVSTIVNVTPNTRIQCLPNAINQSLQFQIHGINGQNAPYASNILAGQIIINLDFIRYTR
jgi:hypothetical protein